MSPIPEKSSRIYVIVGLVLFTLFLLQDFIELRWTWLFEAQKEQMFKRWTGLALSVFIAFQWVLTLVRVVPSWSSKIMLFTKIHKWLGAITPAAYYVHSMEFGYAYLLFLSLCFFGNFLLGMLNMDVIKSKAQWYFQGWMILHVSCSLIVSLLLFYHVYVVFYYK